MRGGVDGRQQRERDQQPDPRPEPAYDDEAFAAVQQKREHAADEDRAVGSERPTARGERDRQLEDEREHEREAKAAARTAAQDDEGQQGPEEIELLLDPERPREREDDVRPGEERHLGERREVPRNRVHERSSMPGADPGDGHHGDVEQQAPEVDGQDPERAPHEEGAPAEGAERILLAQREGRDQEAAEDEEEGDAVPALEPPPEPVRTSVVEDDEQRGDRAEAVEAGEVASFAPVLVAADRRALRHGRRRGRPSARRSALRRRRRPASARSRAATSSAWRRGAARPRRGARAAARR